MQKKNAQIYMDFPIENMQKYARKICKNMERKIICKICRGPFFFCIFSTAACICTPHLADVQVEDTDDIHWRASLGTVTAGRARARGLLLLSSLVTASNPASRTVTFESATLTESVIRSESSPSHWPQARTDSVTPSRSPSLSLEAAGPGAGCPPCGGLPVAELLSDCLRHGHGHGQVVIVLRPRDVSAAAGGPSPGWGRARVMVVP
jgi:hypothetical protein